jgi:hypothetical protein
LTDASCRLSALTENTSENTKRPTLYRTTLLRRSVVAMILGVSWPPATWIATSNEPNVNTRNDKRKRDHRLIQRRGARGPEPAQPPSQPRIERAQHGLSSRTSAMATSGTVHNADLR